MLISFYFFIIPFLIVCFFFGYKFFIYRKDLNSINEEMGEKINNIEEAYIITYDYFYDLKENIIKNLKIFFHWLLHFFVIFLGFISDLTDILYAKSRDFFLKTAAKEKETVNKFWHTLIEYKKESEEEKTEKQNQ